MAHQTRRKFLTGIMATIAAMMPAARFVKMAHAHNDQAVVHIVEIQDFSFNPEIIEVRAGDRISWINRDIAPHTATADDESWDTGTLEKGQQETMIASKGMTMTYFCRHHPSMVANIKLIK